MSSAPEFDYAELIDLLAATAARFDVLHLAECDSTNSELIRRAASGAPSGLVVVCDHQLAGRGRRGRSWLSAPDASLTFSLLWKLTPARSVSGLSLAVGLAVAEALDTLGLAGVGLKWPNDIWLADAKLGGILIETTQGSEALVIGIGLNLRQNPAWDLQTGRAVASIESGGLLVRREAVLAAILRQLAPTLDGFAREGFMPFRERWNARNAFAGKMVELAGDSERSAGICLGADDTGALLLDTPAGPLSFSAGDLSLRPRAGTD